MKKTLKLLATVVTLLLFFTLTGCSNKNDLEKIKSKGQITIGITDYEPMDYQDENGNWIGFDADLAKEFSKYIGVECKFQVITWEEKIIELKSGNIDLIWNGMTKLTDENGSKKISQSISYATNMQCIVCAKGESGNYYTIEEVKNAKIACEKGSAANTVCNTELELEDTKINAVKAQTNALTEVVAGTSDCAIIDYTMAYSVVGKGEYSNLEIVNINVLSFNKEEFVVGLRKGSNLLETLNTFLKEKYNDGTMKNLLNKYEGIALNDSALKD